MESKIGWIDFLKGISIITVIFDHLFNVIYYNHTANLYTVFSVSLFIFLAGVTSVISIDRNKEPLGRYQLRRIKGVFIPYAVATAVYGFVNMGYHFDAENFWSDLIHFRAAGPFYFVVFYCQLILVAPFLFRILINKKFLFQLTSVVIIYALAKYLTHHTEVGRIYGGGGRVLGGSYLFVFYLGMLFFLLYKKHWDKFNQIWMYLVGIILSASLIIVISVSGWVNVGWSNPPNKYTIIYTLSVFVLTFSTFLLASKWRFSKMLLSLIEYVGKYSYYIFLYHLLAIFYATNLFIRFELPEGLTKCVLYLSFAILIPLLIGVITKNRGLIFDWLSDISKPVIGNKNKHSSRVEP